MKIFLTEMIKNGKKYAGPNIIAASLVEAEEAAEGRKEGVTTRKP